MGFLLTYTAVVAKAVTIETVPVGNPGNPADSASHSGNPAGQGAVNYSYYISKFETTAGQYTEFLNKVAATDTYGLYSTGMSGLYGCGINRSGSSGNYTYSVASDWANRPVDCVSWGDAARFCNWLSNGQPTGAQGPLSTEDGSYYLNGATSESALMAVTRKPGATWVIPTEDEWYKAAYQKNDGVTGNYWNYPTRSNSPPSNSLSDTGNNANFQTTTVGPPYTGANLTIGPPYYLTEVGAFGKSYSPYGTFDQGGNIWEWNETAVSASTRGFRGGRWATQEYNSLISSARYDLDPTQQDVAAGFRVADVPEPGSMALLLAAAVGLLIGWKRRK